MFFGAFRKSFLNSSGLSESFLMTSSVAKNSLAESLSLPGGGDPKYLQLNDDGIAPIERQVAQTQQVITSLGNLTLTDPFNGSNNVIVDANLAAGNLTLDLSAAGAYGIQGMYGRTITLGVRPTNAGGARSVLVTLPANHFYLYQGAAVPLVTDSMTFPLTVASTVSLTFVQNGQVIVTGDVTGYTFA